MPTRACLRSIGVAEIPRDHPLSVTVPGCVDGWVELSAELGVLDLADCLAPAIDLADDGFEVSNEQAGAFQATAACTWAIQPFEEFYPGRAAGDCGSRSGAPAWRGP